MTGVLATSYSAAELAHRLRQQELVAAFGLFALRDHDLDAVLAEACRVTAEGLAVKHAKVLEYRPDADDLLVRAGVGWRPGVVGRATLRAGLDSPAGYALRTGEPVVSSRLGEAGGFRVPALLAEHGIHSAINVLIGASPQAGYGVLEVDSTHRHEFTHADVAFVRGVANVSAAAVERQAREAALRQSESLAQRVFECSPDCAKLMDLDGRVRDINGNGVCLLEIGDVADVIGRPWDMLWPEAQRETVRGALAQARAGRVAHFEAPCPTAKGNPRWWDVLVAPVFGEDGRPAELLSISRDATWRRETVARHEELLRDKDLLMQEVHHRVKNSLQLVRTMLQLQARAASPEVRAELDQAARRIMSIGAVHQRLYEGGSVVDTDAADFLGALVADLRDMLAQAAGGREITLDVEPMRLPADQLTPLGVVASELVANALKYGAGRVRVRARRVPEGVRLEVADEGLGFPGGIEAARGRGLGMRIVTAMAKGDPARSVQVDPDCPSRVVVTLTLTG